MAIAGHLTVFLELRRLDDEHERVVNTPDGVVVSTRTDSISFER